VIDGSVRARLELTDTDFSRASVWPFKFSATYTVTVGRELKLEFEVENRDSVPFTYEAALHTYYAVGDVRRTQIVGLQGRPFWRDTVSSAPEAGPIKILEGIGRRYPTATTARIADEANGRTLNVRTDATRGMVLWNPGATNSRELPDMGDEAWKSMLCLENANIREGSVTLSPGERHRMGAHIGVSAL